MLAMTEPTGKNTMDRVMSPRELADKLRASVDFVYDEMQRGNLRFFKVGRQYRIPYAAAREAFPGLFID